MRIVAGKYRHRIIVWPEDNEHIRPTKDRIREAIFNALGNIEEMNVLDLYAGSGAMGIEALSRGAAFATFVDCNDVALKTIRTNLSSLDIDNAEILSMRDDDAISLFINNNKRFDIIILDPPYKEGKYLELIKYCNDKILNKNGIIVVESESDLLFNDFDFSKVKHYHYGKINVDIIWK